MDLSQSLARSLSFTDVLLTVVAGDSYLQCCVLLGRRLFQFETLKICITGKLRYCWISVSSCHLKTEKEKGLHYHHICLANCSGRREMYTLCFASIHAAD